MVFGQAPLFPRLPEPNPTKPDCQALAKRRDPSPPAGRRSQAPPRARRLPRPSEVHANKAARSGSFERTSGSLCCNIYRARHSATPLRLFTGCFQRKTGCVCLCVWGVPTPLRVVESPQGRIRLRRPGPPRDPRLALTIHWHDTIHT